MFPDGLEPTGRKVVGPASDLVELKAENGLAHTAIVFHEDQRDHKSLTESLSVVLGFLESPMVVGLVELSHYVPDEGVFVYPTGQVWSLTEVVRTLRDLGRIGGIRAGLELLYAGGQILMEAVEIGGSEGVYSHGNVSPYRVLLKRDGQVMLVGHALPQVEILRFLEDDSLIPRQDSFRYAPPERMAGEGEDLHSDLFALALTACELMTGKSVYDGLVGEIQQQAKQGEAAARMTQLGLPTRVTSMLSTVLAPEPGDRFKDGGALEDAVAALLSSTEASGPSLMDLMDEVANQGWRAGQVAEKAETTAVGLDEIQAHTGVLDGGAEGRPADVTAPRVSRATSSEDVTDPEPVSVKESSEAEAPKDEPADETATTPEKDAKPKWQTVGRRAPRRRRKAKEEPPTSPPPITPSVEEDETPTIPPRLTSPAPEVPEQPESKRQSDKAADLIASILRSTVKQPPIPEVDNEEATVALAADVLSKRGKAVVQPLPEAEDDEEDEHTTPLGHFETQPLSFRLVVDEGEHSVAFLPNCTAIEAVAEILNHCPPTMDLSGRLTGWPRLAQKGARLSNKPMSAVDTKAPLEVQMVPGRYVQAKIKVPGVKKAIAVTVGTAVPTTILLRQIQSMFGLATASRLLVDGVPMGPWDIVEDRPELGLVIQLQVE